MSPPELTYHGPSIDDIALLARLPSEVRESLAVANGLIALGGGFQIRGACLQPSWHSLRNAWEGPDALATLYPTVAPTDVPVAEDVFGDQFLLRDGIVHTLEGETGSLRSLGLTWTVFLQRLEGGGSQQLHLGAFDRYRVAGGQVAPGQLLGVYPPFVAKASATDRSFRPVPALERRRWLADLARQIRDVPDGGRIEFKVIP